MLLVIKVHYTSFNLNSRVDFVWEYIVVSNDDFFLHTVLVSAVDVDVANFLCGQFFLASSMSHLFCEQPSSDDTYTKKSGKSMEKLFLRSF